MVRTGRWWMVLAATLMVLPGMSIATDKAAGSLQPVSVQEAGNTFYRVFVEDSSISGRLGLYTATTGPDHPAGPGLNVLYGDGSPGTTFNTVRSFTSNTDYVQIGGTVSSNPIMVLSPFGALAPIGTTGFRATYTLPGPPTTPDALTIVQDVNVNGTTFLNSTVEVTTSVTNTGEGAVAIGIRYLWDFEIGDDDGPTFMQRNPFGAVLVDEAEFISPTYESYRMQDNDVNPNPPTFDVFGTVTGPATVVPPPTAPGVLQFADWPLSEDTAFDYAINPTRNIADEGEGSNDSDVLYYFGRDANSAIAIAPGATATVSASLFLTLPQAVTSPVPTLAAAALVALGAALAVGGALAVGRRNRRARAAA